MPEQEQRLCASLHSIGAAALQATALALHAWSGQLPWSVVGLFVLACGLSTGAMALIIHRGWNLRLKDPDMLRAQTGAGIAVQLGLLALVPQLWFLFVTALCLAGAHLPRRWRLRQFIEVCLLIGGGLGIALYVARDHLAHPAIAPMDVFLLCLATLVRVGHRGRRREPPEPQEESSTGPRRLTERERVARELHNTLLQGLHGVILHLQAATERIPPQEPARRMMEDALQCGDQLLLDGREAHARLRAVGGAAADLPDALVAAGEELASGCFTRFRFELKGRRRPLQPAVDDEAYRVAREAMLCAFRHAKACEVVALLCYGDAQLVLQVRDDGIGLDAVRAAVPSAAGRAGMTRMRNRARRAGARVSVSSAAGRGTQIELTVAAALAYSPTG